MSKSKTEDRGQEEEDRGQKNRVKKKKKIEKPNKPKLCNTIFSILLKIGSVVLLDQQIKLVSPNKPC